MPDFSWRPFLLTAAMLLTLLAPGSPPAAAQTLKAVTERGTLNCGVSQGLLGFSSQDDKGEWSGLDVDVCRAVAAAEAAVLSWELTPDQAAARILESFDER